ncbi:GNAT family N-acetyltransferase [Rhodocytophaga aerolata]|uniref:GNAT family N-acetyltransferase n=1 Tax=Rhodocytophaga aerolata TaxID=455078 RepID=A0ABT8R6K5_9BACT|nr:GNAT family N-acetyltransferase [Rhodocytophaga aerolata]MDO1447296.1 GNAT family N-acetyltransferase [Rhodocytophaga aerolata]
MLITSVKNAIIYEILTEKDYEGTVLCAASTFVAGEPMVTVLDIAKKDFLYFSEIFVRKAIADGLSVIAKDAVTGQVVGCMISEDFVTDPPQGIELVAPSLGPIFHMLGTLDERYKEHHSVKQGEIYHQFMLGVLSTYAGKGIGHRLTIESERLAKAKRYKAIMCEVTGPVSQHIFLNQLGYKEVDAIAYHDFVYEGQHIFKHITACESCKLIYKAI